SRPSTTNRQAARRGTAAARFSSPSLYNLLQPPTTADRAAEGRLSPTEKKNPPGNPGVITRSCFLLPRPFRVGFFARPRSPLDSCSGLRRGPGKPGLGPAGG